MFWPTLIQLTECLAPDTQPRSADISGIHYHASVLSPGTDLAVIDGLIIISPLSLSGLLTAGDSKHLSETQGDTTNVDQGRSRLGVAGLRSPEKVSSHDQIRLQGFLISHCTRDIMFHIGFPKSSVVT